MGSLFNNNDHYHQQIILSFKINLSKIVIIKSVNFN